MTGREWKPGDVAMANLGRVFAIACDGVRWVYDDGSGGIENAGLPAEMAEPDNLRPLVVIDPEDREQVERLLSRYSGWRDADEKPSDYPHYVDDMQAALREFANPTPPKPDEPTGLGAVVEDADGKRWIRVTEGDASPWAPLGKVGFFMGWRHYRQISAVRILSEGVTP